jgi:uncharacterized protein YndB with AHSA1/START domain
MSTMQLAGSSAHTMREWKTHLPTDHAFGVSATASVNADRSRIYQALTVPEYVEAWLAVPGAIAGQTGVFAREKSFSISYWCSQQEQCRVFCSYQVRRRSKVVFTWQRTASAEATSSIVRIRLLGDFGRTTVHVTHVGLTLSEQRWHEVLWASSLQKLSKLF